METRLGGVRQSHLGVQPALGSISQPPSFFMGYVLGVSSQWGHLGGVESALDWVPELCAQAVAPTLPSGVSLSLGAGLGRDGVIPGTPFRFRLLRGAEDRPACPPQLKFREDSYSK